MTAVKSARPAISVVFDRISVDAAKALRESGGTIEPYYGRYLYKPHFPRCRWGGVLHRQTMKLPNGRKVVCIPHDQSVELALV
jgi:hypothetical protein